MSLIKFKTTFPVSTKEEADNLQAIAREYSVKAEARNEPYLPGYNVDCETVYVEANCMPSAIAFMVALFGGTLTANEAKQEIEMRSL